MRFLSVCSGIEAASVAWGPLGWQAAALAEIDPFACGVLAARHGATRPMFMPDPAAPDLDAKARKRRAAAIRATAKLPDGGSVPNFGNLEAWKDWPDAAVDVLVGGTPCQSFSVAGLRKGMDDPRGNLALVYLAVVDRYRPRWVVWENVPGVLSSNKGRDFGAFLGGLGELGYGWAYRVLDAQFIRTCFFPGAVPQRRRRVFVVGYLGDWRPPAAVLFDAESLRGNPPPRRRAGQGASYDVAPCLAASGRGFDRPGDTRGQDCLIPSVAHALRAGGFDASEDGTGRGTPLIAHPVAFDCKGTEVQFTTDGAHPPLRSMGHADSHSNAGGHAAVAFQDRKRGDDGRGYDRGPTASEEVCGTLDTTKPLNVAWPWAVRRLTPIECERLQGFPDGYTDVPTRGRNATPDGPRYKALGNSMAVNVMGWIGERIALVEDQVGKTLP